MSYYSISYNEHTNSGRNVKIFFLHKQYCWLHLQDIFIWYQIRKTSLQKGKTSCCFPTFYVLFLHIRLHIIHSHINWIMPQVFGNDFKTTENRSKSYKILFPMFPNIVLMNHARSKTYILLANSIFCSCRFMLVWHSSVSVNDDFSVSVSKEFFW